MLTLVVNNPNPDGYQETTYWKVVRPDGSLHYYACSKNHIDNYVRSPHDVVTRVSKEELMRG